MVDQEKLNELADRIAKLERRFEEEVAELKRQHQQDVMAYRVLWDRHMSGKDEGQ